MSALLQFQRIASRQLTRHLNTALINRPSIFVNSSLSLNRCFSSSNFSRKDDDNNDNNNKKSKKPDNTKSKKKDDTIEEKKDSPDQLKVKPDDIYEAEIETISDILNGTAESSTGEAASGSSVSVKTQKGGNYALKGGSLTTVDANKNSVEKIAVPKEYPQLLAIPLSKRPLFPGFYKTLYITDPEVITAIKNLMERRQAYCGIFLAKDDTSDLDIVNDMSEIQKIGVFCQITNIYPAGPTNEDLSVVVYPHRRIRALNAVPPPKLRPVSSTSEAVIHERPDLYLPHNKHLESLEVGLLNVENMTDEPCTHENPMVKALISELLNVLKDISQINPILRDQIITFSVQTGGNAFQDPSKLADFVAAVSSAESLELQDILESLVIEERLQKSLIVLKKELASAKLQQEIAKQVEKKISKSNQEYYLREQLKGIKKELGMESDGKDKLVEKFKKRALTLVFPPDVQTVFNEEITKLGSLEPNAQEYNVTRNYLDWITLMPWGQHTQENFDIRNAKAILDEDHYGLKDVKDRILEFIAVGKLRGTVQGKIICLAGPPGVGKTSIGKSIARSLGREFFRFSVGGLADVAEIKGHRRTYVGAMPGKVIQALKKVQKENPLIMIDEIDKLGRGNQGDPASALLELLDPEQNNSFLDHYMDVPVDLSKVLFVCTANVLDTIPGPLLDRMEVINVSGYVEKEKVAIASKYLIPVSKKESGLDEKEISISDEAITQLIKQYCRESGVRNLKKHIDKVFRKSALKLVEAEASDTPLGQLQVTPANLKDYVGAPIFTSDRMYAETPSGVVMGLAWTSMGGSSLYIESAVDNVLTEDSKPGFHYTGQMGDVMKESAQIAYTYSKSFMAKKYPDNKFFQRASIHLHVPEGATPKDGPSAGVTMTTSLLSLALNRPLANDIAMTGELTLTGKVLKIGGVKEKTIAAKRSGVTNIFFPKSNQSDWEDLEDYIKDGMTVRFADYYSDIFDYALEKTSE